MISNMASSKIEVEDN